VAGVNFKVSRSTRIPGRGSGGGRRGRGEAAILCVEVETEDNVAPVDTTES